MRVVVAGATGKQGRGALWYLLRQPEVSHLVVGARTLARAQALATELQDSRLSPCAIDLSDVDASAATFEGADVVVNCAYEGYPTDDSYENLELTATHAVLRAGTHYVGVGGAPCAPKQLALDPDFRRRERSAILGMGELTGHVQIMAAYGVRQLDTVTSIRIRSGTRDLVPPERHSRPLAWGSKPGEKGKTNVAYAGLGATRFRYGAASVSYEKGQFVYTPPRGNPEVFAFREPVGPLTVAQTPGAAVISLARSYPQAQHISIKAGGPSDFDTKVNFLRDLGLFRTEPIDAQGQCVAPWDVLMTMLEQLPPEKTPADLRSETCVITQGTVAGRPVEYAVSWLRIEPNDPAHPAFPWSGLCAAIVTMMLGRGEISGSGVRMPEVCVPPQDYLNEFAKIGMVLEITETIQP